MENLKIEVIVFPQNSTYQNRLTELIQENWFIVDIEMVTPKKDELYYLVFKLERGLE